MKLDVRPEWTLRRQLYHRTVERDDATLRQRCSHNRREQRQDRRLDERLPDDGNA